MFQMLYLEILLQLFHLLFFQWFLVFHVHILLWNFLFDLIFHLVVINITFFHLDVLLYIFSSVKVLQSSFQHLLEVLLGQISYPQISYLFYYKLFFDNLLVLFQYFQYRNTLKIFQPFLYLYYFVKYLVWYLIALLNYHFHMFHKSLLSL